MWQVVSRNHSDGTILARLDQDGDVLSYAGVIDLLSQSDRFCSWFAATLADVPYSSYFWEVSPVTSQVAASLPFECALIDAPMLAAQAPDTRSFAEYFCKSDHNQTVAVMPNLGGDAMMVVPEIIGTVSAYTDLASFLRKGPEAQKIELLRSLAAAIRQRLGQRPLWVSTSGLGVAWLHVRLDSYPKYYQYRPFREYRSEQ